MFHVTTHTGAERALHEGVAPIRRIGPRAFAALVGLELLLLLGVLVWALAALLPAATPLATRSSIAPVEDAVRAHLSGGVNDPLISVAPGLSARASNLRGFSLAGKTYYYYVEGSRNFDPLSRGAVSPAEIEVLLRDETGPQPFVVYRIL